MIWWWWYAGKYSHRNECVHVHPSIHLSIGFYRYCYCLRLSFNKFEKGILITNNELLWPHSKQHCISQKNAFRTKRWLIVFVCVMCEFTSIYGVKSNLFRSNFIWMFKLSTLGGYWINSTTTTWAIYHSNLKPIQHIIEDLFLFIVYCETMSSFFRCK